MEAPVQVEDEATFLRKLSSLRTWQVRNVALSLGVVGGSRCTKTAMMQGVRGVYADPSRRDEASKAVEAIRRGLKRPWVVKSLRSQFDEVADSELTRLKHMAIL